MMYRVLINGNLFGKYITLSEATRVVYGLVDLEPSVNRDDQNSIDIKDEVGCIIHYNRVINMLTFDKESMIRKCGCWNHQYCWHSVWE